MESSGKLVIGGPKEWIIDCPGESGEWGVVCRRELI